MPFVNGPSSRRLHIMILYSLNVSVFLPAFFFMIQVVQTAKTRKNKIQIISLHEAFCINMKSRLKCKCAKDTKLA